MSCKSPIKLLIHLVLCHMLVGHVFADHSQDHSQKMIPAAVCLNGQSTVLELSGLTPSIHHDGPDGRAVFSVRSSSDAIIWSKEMSGEGRCLGFSIPDRKYIIGLLGEAGTSWVLGYIGYVPESSPKLITSAHSLVGIEGQAVVISPTGRYLALIGVVGDRTQGELEQGLWVLDTFTDRVRRVGPAPSPPPQPDSSPGEVWPWFSAESSFREIEPEILHWQNGSVLTASYGEDTPRSRARKRYSRKWDMASIFGPGPQND